MNAIRVASLVLVALPLMAQDNPLEPKEYTVPFADKGRTRDPILARDGKVWFVGQSTNYVAYLMPSTGEFKRYTIDPGTNPHNIVTDPNGGIWFTGNRNNRIVNLNPENGELKTYRPDSTVRDPHTMIFGTDGIAWFTAQQSQKVGRFDPKTGEFKIFTPSQPRSNPYGMVVDKTNRPWFNLFATNRVGTIDPKTLEYKEYVFPNERMRARRLALTSDGMVWVGDYQRGYIAKLDPKTGAVEEWPLPEGNGSLPYAMTVDDQDRLWLAETGVQPNRLVAFDPKTKTFVANVPILSNGAASNTIRHMTFDTRTKTIWFGTDAGTIGGMKVPAVIQKLVP